MPHKLFLRLQTVWSSLRLRLILMFMLVVIVAIGTVALLASQATASNLQAYNQTKNNQHIMTTLLTAYRQHVSQQALQALIDQLAHDSHQRLILLDPQRRVIADSDHKLIGQVISEAMLVDASFFASSSSSAKQSNTSLSLFSISIDAQTQTPNLVEYGLNNNSSEATFLTSVNRALWLAVLIAGLTALLLALLFSSALVKPLHTLKAAAGRMEQGDLNQRVTIKGKGEVSALAHAFNTMAESLSRSEQAHRNLVSDVAHELRNPLMNIRGYLELLQDQTLEPTPETIASLYEETSLLSRLVADLQDVSLAEAGQLHLKRQALSLEEVVSQAAQMAQPSLARKDLALHVCLPPNLPDIEADQERVAQILRNLFSNAITHTPDKGKICITASACESLVRISVQDTGTGIAPEHLPYLFERFYRVDASRTRATGGTGLGLAVVKQLVQAHGGQITVTSLPGQGSCFTFTLPAVSTPFARKAFRKASLSPGV